MTDLVAWLVVIWTLVAIVGLLWYRLDKERRRSERMRKYLDGLPRRHS